jgi:quercetin dioxygenase-like cupin family protein
VHTRRLLRPGGIYLSGLMESGQFKPVIDRTLPLEDIVAAYEYVETGQKIGNVVITVHPEQEAPSAKQSLATPISEEMQVEIQPKPPTAKGPADWFTGDVWLDGIARGEEPSRVRVNAVRFTPSARTAWHSHALGQTLYVTEGRGLAQSRDGEVQPISAGDIIYTPADEWHWHGAAPDHFMSHLSITEAVPSDGRPDTEWGEHVTDAEYKRPVT